MSLLDSFLLDPAPFEVWIAVRTDGVRGSGTASDPYNGTPSLKVDLLTASGTIATATLAAGHGLQNNDSVLVTGATGTDAIRWNGIFTISNVGTTSFQYTMTAAPTTSPASGQILMAKVAASRFDELMSGMPPNTCVHLGPGTFLTKGYRTDNETSLSGWQPKAGMKMIGSGIEVTTIQLINATVAGAHYCALGHALTAGTQANYFEIAELTIDCNLPTSPGLSRRLLSHRRPAFAELVVKNNRLENPNTGKSPSFVHGPNNGDLSKVEQWVATS